MLVCPDVNICAPYPVDATGHILTENSFMFSKYPWYIKKKYINGVIARKVGNLHEPCLELPEHVRF